MKYLIGILAITFLGNAAFGSERERIVDVEVEMKKAMLDIEFNEVIQQGQEERKHIREDISAIVSDAKKETREREKVQEFIKVEMKYNKKQEAQLKKELGIVPDTDSDTEFFKKDNDRRRNPSSKDEEEETIVEVTALDI